MVGARCLVVFTKPAIPGRVKTRLIGALAAEEAAELHEAFLGDLLERLVRGRFEIELAWSLDPREPVPGGPHHGIRQQGSDLGERLWKGLSETARRFAFVAAVGSDHPDLPVERVEEAFAKLEEGADVVLGPAEDGGYYLVGARAESLERRLFEEIEWSTCRVLEETLARCRELELRVVELAPAADVDTPTDLRRLARRLAGESGADGASDSPRTERLLRSWNWIEGD